MTKIKNVLKILIPVIVMITMVILLTEHPAIFFIGFFTGVAICVIVIPIYIIFRLGSGIDHEDYVIEEGCDNARK